MGSPKRIEPTQALGFLRGSSDLSAHAISRECGRSINWLINSTGRDTKASTLALVADVLGLDLALVDRANGEVMAIIEPARDD